MCSTGWYSFFFYLLPTGNTSQSCMKMQKAHQRPDLHSATGYCNIVLFHHNCMQLSTRRRKMSWCKFQSLPFSIIDINRPHQICSTGFTVALTFYNQLYLICLIRPCRGTAFSNMEGLIFFYPLELPVHL